MWVKTSIIGLVAVAVLTGCSGQSQAYAPLHNVCKATAGLELEKGPEQGELLVQEIQGELAVDDAASNEEAAPFLAELEKLKTLNSDKAVWFLDSESFRKIFNGALGEFGKSDEEIDRDIIKEKSEIADASLETTNDDAKDFAVRGDLIEDKFEAICEDYLEPAN
jgi:hypothetical protein